MKNLTNTKLNSLLAQQVRELAKNLGLDISKNASKGHLCAIITESNPNEGYIDSFIKEKYKRSVEERQHIISDKDLRGELNKVMTMNIEWPVIQGELDRYIQRDYVRKLPRLDDLKGQMVHLNSEVAMYTLRSWFNYWSTVLIEDHISLHNKVVPTIKSVRGLDLFWAGKAWDLKITPFPKDIKNEFEDINGLSKWLYENQGQQRFGDDDRIYVILFDENNRNESWKLKGKFDLIFPLLDIFLNDTKLYDSDEIVFTYNKKSYTATAKALVISNPEKKKNENSEKDKSLVHMRRA